MKIIACLGNPGKKYSKTRHNIGFIAGSSFAKANSINISRKNFSSWCGTGKIDGVDILLLFPETYMNSSGAAVKEAMNYYRVEGKGLLAIHDEIELPFGGFNMKFGGGHRGHNGLRSIFDKTGSADFHRLRFGVGRPDNPHISVADYVLSDFLEEELARLDVLMPEIHGLIKSFVLIE